MTTNRTGPQATTGRRRAVRRRILTVAAATVAGAAALAAGALAPSGASPAGAAPAPTPAYQLSLGDSLAAGTGASTPADDYVNRVAAHEAATFPGLTVENVACGGATTTTVLSGGGACTYAQGTQLAEAEAFLAAHPGQVPYVTIDIGANDVDGCLTGATISLSCIVHGIQAISTQLPQIVAGLRQAAPGVPIFGMDYYNPFLAEWVLGGAGGPSLARESAVLSADLNGLLVQIYGAAGAIPVDVQGPFATQDFALTGTWNGAAVPEGVARTCDWTHMCDTSGLTIHTNDIGHATLAAAVDRAVDRRFRGGGAGAWLADAAGGVHTVGTAASYGSMAGRPLDGPVVGLAPTSDGRGYWMAGADGAVYAFGDAGFYGSAGGTPLRAPVVGMVPTSDDHGYWLVAADGGVFAFGDAAFLGSMGGTTLTRPVVGMAQTGSDRGYWLVAADGGVFAFGDAGFLGSMGATPLARPVVGVAPTVDGNGYWLVASDGGVFSFGDALFHGSTGGQVLNRPVTGMTASPSGYGYTLAAADGGMFALGDAAFVGSLAGDPPAAPVVAVAST